MRMELCDNNVFMKAGLLHSILEFIDMIVTSSATDLILISLIKNAFAELDHDHMDKVNAKIVCYSQHLLLDISLHFSLFREMAARP